MTENNHDNELEELLRKFRPTGPPDSLRQRVLSTAQPDTKPPRIWRIWAFRAAVAAMFLLVVGLRLAPIIFLLAVVSAAPGKGF